MKNTTETEQMPEFLPVTVIAAILLFGIREFLEWRRRKRTDRRKRSAIRKILIALCERNLWVIKSLNNATSAIDAALKADMDNEVTVTEDSRDFLVWRIKEGRGFSGAVIPMVQVSQLEKFLLDAALLGDTLFDAMIDAYEALTHLEHIRSGLYEYVKSWNDKGEPHIVDFHNYASDELEDIQLSLSKLYAACNGKEPFKHRVR